MDFNKLRRHNFICYCHSHAGFYYIRENKRYCAEHYGFGNSEFYHTVQPHDTAEMYHKNSQSHRTGNSQKISISFLFQKVANNPCRWDKTNDITCGYSYG